MKKYYDTLRKTALFQGLSDEELTAVLPCLGALTRKYARGEALLLAGARPQAIGVVLSGTVHVSRESLLGESMLVASFEAGELFGESIVCAGIEESPVRVEAAADCEVLYVRPDKLLATCSTGCRFHTRLIENMVRMLAEKNLLLNAKMELLSQRSTRDKLLAYFDTRMRRGGAAFELPFTREELADYLGVNRSAMSRELGKMREEGLIEISGRRVRVLR